MKHEDVIKKRKAGILSALKKGLDDVILRATMFPLSEATIKPTLEGYVIAGKIKGDYKITLLEPLWYFRANILLKTKYDTDFNSIEIG